MSMDFMYKEVTDKILKILESGTIPWKTPWKRKDFPMNLKTKIPYKGINVFMLLHSKNNYSPYWATWKQIEELGGTVKDGEAKNYETVIFFKMMQIDKNTSKSGKNENIPILRYSRVYNLGQINLPEAIQEKIEKSIEPVELDPIQSCEAIVSNYKDCPEISFGCEHASYTPLFDRVKMPNRNDFFTIENYYGTLFHELGHSTGSEKRLKRFKPTDGNMFGKDAYSKEELVAEMTASFLCAETGIVDNTIESSAAYIDGWTKAIKNGNKNLVISAASKASYAAEYILGKRTVEVDIE